MSKKQGELVFQEEAEGQVDELVICPVCGGDAHREGIYGHCKYCDSWW
jgi:hypothetical protein